MYSKQKKVKLKGGSFSKEPRFGPIDIQKIPDLNL